MVGQSVRGMNVRLYASHHPDKVPGMVLVDAAHEDMAEIINTIPWSARVGDNLRWLRFRLNLILARLGILRLRKMPNGVVDGLPEDVQPVAMALGLRSRAYDWLWGLEAGSELSEAQLRNSPPLPDIPLTVLSAKVRHGPFGIPADEANRYWMALQADLASWVPNSTHIVSDTGGHMIHIDDPKLVIDAIRQVVETVRAKR
jgi:pimeloyl-ACP methyl ester carboxylesterase